MIKFSIKNLFSYGLAVFIQKSAAILILPIIAANLTVKDFGMVNQIISLGGLYILIVMLGFDEGIAKKGFDNNSEKDKYITNGFFILIINAFLFGIFAYYFSDIFYGSFVKEIPQMLITLSIVLIISTPFYLTFLKILRLSNRSKDFFQIICFQVAVQSALLIFFIVFLGLGAIGFLLAHVITTLLCSIFSIFNLRSSFHSSFMSATKSKELFLYSSKVMPHAIFSWGLWGLSVVYCGKYMGSEASAQLVAINYVAVIANVISFAFFYTYQGWLYQNLKTKQKVRTIINNIIIFLFGFFIMLLLIFLFTDQIFNFIFDDRYIINYLLVKVLLVASFFQFLGSIFSYVLYYFEEVTKHLGATTIMGGVINLILLMTISGDFGLVGVGLSFMIAQLVVSLIRGYIALKTLRNYEKVNQRLEN